MIVKMNSQASFYRNNSKASGIYELKAQSNSAGQDYNSAAALVSQRLNQSKQAATDNKNRDMRDLLRGLDNNNANKSNNPHKATIASKVNGFLDTKSQYQTKDKLNLKKYKYSYKQISSKILSAKTSVSAGQAVIAAKRKVIEVKRKLAANPKDSDELQAALVHAERMEMAARKKKHNLEMEELVSDTMKRDDYQEKIDESSEASQDTMNSLIEQKEEEIFDKLQEAIAEFGEEELKALEDEMQLMESMEIIDPHMSEADFNKMKAKHRADEQKAIMKADMDYLKAIVKNNLDSGVKPYSDIGASTAVPAPAIDMSL